LRVGIALNGGSVAVIDERTAAEVRHRLAALDALVVSPSRALIIGASQCVELLLFQLEAVSGRHQSLRACSPFRFRDRLVASAAQALAEQLTDGQSLAPAFASAIVDVILNRATRAQTAAAETRVRLVAPLFGAQLRRIDDYIDARLAAEVRLADLARLTGTSVSHFMRRFRASRGTSPHAYVVERKLRCAADLLARSDLPIAEIARRVGLNRSHFARAFSAHFAMSPRALRSRESRSIHG
jgi:AraC-like DNA-binding protein